VAMTTRSMPAATRRSMDSARIGLFPRRRNPFGVLSPSSPSRTPMPAARITARRTRVMSGAERILRPARSPGFTDESLLRHARALLPDAVPPRLPGAARARRRVRLRALRKPPDAAGVRGEGGRATGALLALVQDEGGRARLVPGGAFRLDLLRQRLRTPLRAPARHAHGPALPRHRHEDRRLQPDADGDGRALHRGAALRGARARALPGRAARARRLCQDRSLLLSAGRAPAARSRRARARSLEEDDPLRADAHAELVPEDVAGLPRPLRGLQRAREAPLALLLRRQEGEPSPPDGALVARSQRARGHVR